MRVEHEAGAVALAVTSYAAIAVAGGRATSPLAAQRISVRG